MHTASSYKPALTSGSRIVRFSSPVHNEPAASVAPTEIGGVSKARFSSLRLIFLRPILLCNPYVKPCIAHMGARMYVCVLRRSPGSMSFLTGSSSCKSAF